MTWQNVRPWLLDSASHTDRTQGCRVPWGSGQSSPRGWQRFSTDRLQTAPGWGCRRIYQWIPEVCAHTLKMMKMKNVTLEYNVCYDIIWTIKKGKLRIQAINFNYSHHDFLGGSSFLHYTYVYEKKILFRLGSKHSLYFLWRFVWYIHGTICAIMLQYTCVLSGCIYGLEYVTMNHQTR